MSVALTMEAVSSNVSTRQAVISASVPMDE